MSGSVLLLNHTSIACPGCTGHVVASMTVGQSLSAFEAVSVRCVHISEVWAAFRSKTAKQRLVRGNIAGDTKLSLIDEDREGLLIAV
eukprot:COSAG02_NODE_161_length_32629_cov_10.363142_15_plen_87_part_00